MQVTDNFVVLNTPGMALWKSYFHQYNIYGTSPPLHEFGHLCLVLSILKTKSIKVISEC